MIVFKSPLVLLVIPFVIAGLWFLNRLRRSASLRFSSAKILEGSKLSWRHRLLKMPFIFQLIAVTVFLIALAGPRSVLEYTEMHSEGIDIILAIDVSGSMAAEDFMLNGHRQSRLDVVKAVVRDFIKERRNDRIGIVAFAQEAYTVSPLTTDQDWLLDNLDRLKLGLIKDGTAIGSGLSSALVRLKESHAKSKVVILLTDGVNNAGAVSPLEAAKMAKAMNIKVYTIGAGTHGLVPYPVEDIWGRKQYQRVQIDIDEATLKKIAQETGGQYFRADDTESLRQIYQKIDQMEKTKIIQHGYREYKELFTYLLTVGLLLLGLALLLKNSMFFTLPGD